MGNGKDKDKDESGRQSTEGREKGEAERQGLKADRHRMMLFLDSVLERRPVQVVLVGAMIALTALLVGPSLSRSDSLLQGLKVGEPAKKTIKAARRFDLEPSKEVLSRMAAEAEAKVLPVFNYRVDRGVRLLTNVNRGFEAVTAAEVKVQPPSKKSDDQEPKRPPRPSREELRRRFSTALGVDVRTEIFDTFYNTDFSADLRGALVALVGGVMDKLIVAHKNVLKPFAGKPITVRRLQGGQTVPQGEEKLDNFRGIKDPLQIKQYVLHQADVYGAKLPGKVRKAMVALVQSLVIANVNLTFDQDETNRRKMEARKSIRGHMKHYAKGEVIVGDGMLVTKQHRRAIAKMESAYRGVSRVQVTLVGIALLVMIFLLVINRFAGRHFRGFHVRPRDLLTMGMLALGLLGLTRGSMELSGGLSGGMSVVPFLLPVAAGPMLVRLLISAEAAALFAVVVGSLCGLLLERSGNLGFMLFYLLTGMVGAAGMAKVQSRSTVLRAGLLAGAVGAVTAGCLALVGGFLEASTIVSVTLAALGGGMIASFVTLALLPALEWLFAYVTDVSLLELANLNHPLLRDLMIRAPGTYHHSMVVGNLSEAACEAIGANPLLGHVAANFHDVGKMKNAPYFAENFKGSDNPHNRLKPSMSGLIIRNHLKHTIEMLREHAVPDPVLQIATQHHGTTLIEFFFHKAKKEADEESEEVREEDYRYPGPKPQTREAGVLMLADGVEAAARSLGEPTEDRLRSVVQRVINAKFADGQLDHCDLTLRDLHLIAKAFLQVLRGIYHQRPTYPWQRDRDATARRRVAEERNGKKKDEGEAKRPDGKSKDNTKETKQDGKKQDGKKEGRRKNGKAAKQSDDKDKDETQVGKSKRSNRNDGTFRADGKKTNGQKSDAKKADAKKADGKKADGKKADGKKADGRKADRDANKADVAKAERGKKSEARPAEADGAEPEGDREGSPAAEPSSPDEITPESSPDIKRLGLN